MVAWARRKRLPALRPQVKTTAAVIANNTRNPNSPERLPVRPCLVDLGGCGRWPGGDPARRRRSRKWAYRRRRQRRRSSSGRRSAPPKICETWPRWRNQEGLPPACRLGPSQPLPQAHPPRPAAPPPRAPHRPAAARHPPADRTAARRAAARPTASPRPAASSPPSAAPPPHRVDRTASPRRVIPPSAAPPPRLPRGRPVTRAQFCRYQGVTSDRASFVL